MKTVSGRVVSSKPISLPKAASVLSTFVSADRGASQAVSAYLSRASAAFNELAQFHKELKARRSERKHRTSGSEAFDTGNSKDSDRISGGEGPPSEGKKILRSEDERNQGYLRISDRGNFDEEGRNSGRKKKKKKKGDLGGFQLESEERYGGDHEKIEEEKNKERRKRKKREIKDEEFSDTEERHSKKKKRKHE